MIIFNPFSQSTSFNTLNEERFLSYEIAFLLRLSAVMHCTMMIYVCLYITPPFWPPFRFQFGLTDNFSVNRLTAPISNIISSGRQVVIEHQYATHFPHAVMLYLHRVFKKVVPP